MDGYRDWASLSYSHSERGGRPIHDVKQNGLIRQVERPALDERQWSASFALTILNSQRAANCQHDLIEALR